MSVVVTDHYDRLFKEVQSKLQCEVATGLLLIFPHHCVHVLEVGSLPAPQVGRAVRGWGQRRTFGAKRIVRPERLFARDSISYSSFQKFSRHYHYISITHVDSSREGKVFTCVFVCLFVCLFARYLKNRCS